MSVTNSPYIICSALKSDIIQKLGVQCGGWVVALGGRGSYRFDKPQKEGSDGSIMLALYLRA